MVLNCSVGLLLELLTWLRLLQECCASLAARGLLLELCQILRSTRRLRILR